MTWNLNVNYCSIHLADIHSAPELDSLLDDSAAHIDAQLRLDPDGDLWVALWHLDDADNPDALTHSLLKDVALLYLRDIEYGSDGVRLIVECTGDGESSCYEWWMELVSFFFLRSQMPFAVLQSAAFESWFSLSDHLIVIRDANGEMLVKESVDVLTVLNQIAPAVLREVVSAA